MSISEGRESFSFNRNGTGGWIQAAGWTQWIWAAYKIVHPTFGLPANKWPSVVSAMTKVSVPDCLKDSIVTDRMSQGRTEEAGDSRVGPNIRPRLLATILFSSLFRLMLQRHGPVGMRGVNGGQKASAYRAKWRRRCRAVEMLGSGRELIRRINSPRLASIGDSSAERETCDSEWSCDRKWHRWLCDGV